MAASRRGLMTAGLALGGGALAFHYVGPWLTDKIAGDFVFEHVDRPAGFRRLVSGQTSRGFDPLFGVGRGADDGLDAKVDAMEPRVIEVLFGGEEVAEGVVRLASFSDYNCPYCRILTKRLIALEADMPGRLQISWHELPLLGPTSLSAAKGALAARRQGAYLAFHKRLMRASFQATPEYLALVADDLGIDQSKFIDDVESAAVRSEIEESLVLARLLGIAGTPSLVVGRTVVQGEISERALSRLIELERVEGQ